MARAIEGFQAIEFREGIRLAMEMGMPAQPDRWPVFVHKVTPDTIGGLDHAGVPWDPNTQPERIPDKRITDILCAVEFLDPVERSAPYGATQPQTVHITLLDEEYEAVEGFDHVELFPTLTGNPTIFHYRKVLEHHTLDTVGVWILECATEDQV